MSSFFLVYTYLKHLQSIWCEINNFVYITAFTFIEINPVLNYCRSIVNIAACNSVIVIS